MAFFSRRIPVSEPSPLYGGRVFNSQREWEDYVRSSYAAGGAEAVLGSSLAGRASADVGGDIPISSLLRGYVTSYEGGGETQFFTKETHPYVRFQTLSSVAPRILGTAAFLTAPVALELAFAAPSAESAALGFPASAPAGGELAVNGVSLSGGGFSLAAPTTFGAGEVLATGAGVSITDSLGAIGLAGLAGAKSIFKETVSKATDLFNEGVGKGVERFVNDAFGLPPSVPGASGRSGGGISYLPFLILLMLVGGYILTRKRKGK